MINKILKLSGVLGIVVACGVAFSVLDMVKHRRSTINVNGLADRVIKSDEAVLSISFTVESNKLSDLQSDLTQRTSVVTDFLRKYGFSADEITETSDEITDRLADRYYRYSSASVEKPENRYSLSRKLIVKTKQVDIARGLNSHLTDLYAQNIDAKIDISYLSSDFEKIRLDLLGEALEDAKGRAEKLAKISNQRISGLRTISTGRFIILDGENFTTREWSDGEHSYMKRYRVILNATFDKN